MLLKLQPLKILLCAALLGALTISCNKEKIDEHPAFIGEWYHSAGSTDIYISIDSDGYSEYYKTSAFGFTEIAGRFKIKGGDKLKIGVKKLAIDAYPTEDEDGIKSMTLDGDQYFNY